MFNDNRLSSEILAQNTKQIWKCTECKDSQTFFRTIVESPQWKAWVEHAHGSKWDTVEAEELGLISKGHFQDFLKFTNEKS